MRLRLPTGLPVIALLCALLVAGPTLAAERLVFGSFKRPDNAQAFAERLSEQLQTLISVVPVISRGAATEPLSMYRVVSAVTANGGSSALLARAVDLGHQPWHWRGIPDPVVPATAAAPSAAASTVTAAGATRPTAVADGGTQTRTEFDLGLQSRAYARPGLDRQSRWQLSASGQFDWYRAWSDERHSVTISPFFRIDGEDDERSHVDLREGFYRYVGDRFELHIGARQVFWGVTEFSHLVDIINQTDLVENIDGEDKLGQGMVQLSLSEDWGVLDLFLLTGNRERTFAGRNGRLRFALPVATDDAQFESGAGRQRLDGAIRWSHYAGPWSWGVHHFSGTSRDPFLQLRTGAAGAELVPYYPVIDQTGLDAQWLAGDWALKLEALSRSGDGERYAAANVGLERTLVGAFGTRADLGIVVEYLFDERGDDAHSTLFERDVALGTRWALNDAASTEALLGVIWDTRTDELIVSIEATRQLGSTWQLALEGRAFSGAPRLDAAAQLAAFSDGSAKSAFLQSDDFVQLELTRFF